MTSMNVARIEQYNQSSRLQHIEQSQPANLITGELNPLSAQIDNHEVADMAFSVSEPSIDYPADAGLIPSQKQKRKRQVAFNQSTLTCSMRTDLTKREHGNNPYGRKGNRRCLLCRKRRIKVRLLHNFVLNVVV